MFPSHDRQLLINISEDLVKPNSHESWFGEQGYYRVNERLQEQPDTRYFIFTDTGFQSEFTVFKALTSDIAEVHLIQLHRPNHDFSNDSREYVEDKWDDTHLIYNDLTLASLKVNIHALLNYGLNL